MHGPPQSGKPTLLPTWLLMYGLQPTLLHSWLLCTDLHNLENLHYCLIGPYMHEPPQPGKITYITAYLALMYGPLQSRKPILGPTAYLALMHGDPQTGKPTLLLKGP